MNSPAHDVIQYLVDQSIGALGGETQWSLHLAVEPDAPANVITIYDTGGGEPDTDQHDGRPTFQVRVRAASYQEGYTKQVAIREALTEPAEIVAEDSRMLIFAETEIIPIGRDDSNRHLFTANYRAVRTAN